MLTKFKNLSLMTKLLYLFTLIVLAVWVIPQMTTYYSNVEKYKKNIQELENISTTHGLNLNTKKFSKELFKQDNQVLFSKVNVENIDDKTYIVNIAIKKENLKNFHTFIETISLKYYVKIEDALEFKTQDEVINVTMILKEL